MYYFRDDTSPNDLLWEEIDIDGVIGEDQDSPYHSSIGIKHPIRVAPDGSIVVLGSGRIYDAITLEQINSLSNDIVDAVWDDGTLYTLRSVNGNAQVQKWSSSYALVDTQSVMGSSQRIFAISNSLLVISEVSGAPWFSILDSDLNLLFPYYIYFPCMIREYCQPWLMDDFSDPASGWPVLDTNEVSISYLNEEYRINLKESFWYAAATPGIYASDFITTVDVRNDSGVDGTYGLMFGISDDWNQFYLFEIDKFSWYGLYRYDTGNWTTLVYTYNSAIDGGTSSNTLKIAREGTKIRYFANGTFLGQFTDGTLTGMRRIGVAAFSYENPNVDARFDNFSVYPVTCEEALSMVSPGTEFEWEFQRGGLIWPLSSGSNTR
jgi:hypothetical protein